MSDPFDKLRATLRDLEQELASAEPLDDDARQLLEQAAQDIRAKLARTALSGVESESLIDRMHSAARRFESTHPTLSGILEQIAEGLAQLGI